MADRMEKEKAYLTELDNAIADGDHGINMARGFAAVKGKLGDYDGKDAGTILKSVGMTLVSVVAGSAGPLYGTAFMRSGMALTDKFEINKDDFAACLKASIDGVMMRGKAQRGEKTMLDAMIPMYDAFTCALESGKDFRDALKYGIDAAWEGVEYTKTIAATKGRASYIGERSIGHIDPGAVSFTCLMEEIYSAL